MKLRLNSTFGELIRTLILLIFVLFLSVTVSPVLAWQNKVQNDKPIKKRALLIGISNYFRPNFSNGWQNLHSKGDVEILADVLIRKFEFKPEDIKILCDEDVMVGGKKILATKPTHKLIVDTFRSFLIAQTQEGDVAYFHFSGHGQQVPDIKDISNLIVGDELDGYDETIIPLDYKSQTDGSMNIRDDEIGQLLGELSQKKPSNVTISIDSCYSGTATRGAIERGDEWKGVPVDKSKIRGEDDDVADFLTRGNGSRGGNDNEQNYVFLSAASQKQKAREITENNQGYGAFTYALAKAMESSGDKTTYRDLFQKITDVITRTQNNQTPQIEGNFLDKILMKDGALPPQKFVNVKFNDTGIPYFAAGKLQGLTKGSKFNLCLAEAKDCTDKDKIVTAEIDNVNPTSATIKLENNVGPEKLKNAARGFEIFHNYEDILKVAVKEEGRGSNAELNSVFANLGIITKVSPEDNSWNILIRNADNIDAKENKDCNGLVLQRKDGSIIKCVTENTKDTGKEIQEALLGEANWLTVKSLGDTADANLQNVIKLDLIPMLLQKDPITGKPIGCEEKPESNLYSRGGKIELRVDDCVRLKITNIGKEDLYVTVLDLRPDGKISSVFPEQSNDNIIPADGKPRLFSYLQITEPTGKESFYAIVTKIPTDFSPLISPDLLQRGNLDERGGNAMDSPLGKILINSQKGKRSSPIQPPASWATTSLDFFVIAKEKK